jgi:hypothetical protein
MTFGAHCITERKERRKQPNKQGQRKRSKERDLASFWKQKFEHLLK